MATGIEKRRFADVQHAGAGFVARIARRMVRRGRRACAAARDSFYRYARSGRYTGAQRAACGGQIELTFEVVYGHAWKERARTSTSSPEGYGVVKLENILGRSK